jgi:hypothetical protein
MPPAGPTEQPNPHRPDQKPAGSGKPEPLEAVETPAHLEEDYQYVSGIVERVGHVPIWLQLVYYALIVWGVYYIVRYWAGE